MLENDVVIDGRRVHYRFAGSGPPLVLLHPIGESSFSWTRVAPALATAHLVLAPDLPGFGESEPLDGVPTPDRLAGVVRRLLDLLAAAPATVVGNSFGGAIALELALRFPERVSRLALVSSAGLGWSVNPALQALVLPGYGDLAIAWSRTRVGAAERAWLRVPLLFANPALAPPDWLCEQRRLARLPHHLEVTLAALREQVSAGWGQRRVLLPQLSRVGMPTLLVWGTNDWVFPVCHAEAARARLPNVRVHILAGCGHLPQLEYPERFVAALAPFTRV
jgi:2-hydroxy-6-oxonona-2,4-dienedioate hydrolase